MAKIRVGTRGSALAGWQANWVREQLEARRIEVELILIKTRGDQNQHGSIGSIGSQGVFTREIQNALLEDRIDLAVHSLKDLPTDPVPELTLAAVPLRGATRDAFVSRQYDLLVDLPAGAVVGTGSMRRKTQLKHLRPDLEIRDIRGNVETRLKKLDAGDYDAIVLAEAGLERLGLAENITELLEPPFFLSAVGQGALGLEIRRDDHATQEQVGPLNHLQTRLAVTAERSLLSTLRGGCLAPIAAWGSEREKGVLTLQARVLSMDGKTMLEVIDSVTFQSEPMEDARRLGEVVAERLFDCGAAALIESARKNESND